MKLSWSLRHLFDEHDVIAQALEATDVVTPHTFGVVAIEVVHPKIVMRLTMLQYRSVARG